MGSEREREGLMQKRCQILTIGKPGGRLTGVFVVVCYSCKLSVASVITEKLKKKFWEKITISLTLSLLHFIS